MRLLLLPAFALLAITGVAHAQSAVQATCKDGTSFSGTSRRGACGGHGGVKSFASTGANPLTSTGPVTPGAPSVAPGPTAPGPAASAAAPSAPYTTGQVWVNSSTKVYHCPGDRYYGKTKAGSYMPEAAAKAAGDHPDHGKACS